MLQKNLFEQLSPFHCLFENHPDGISIVDREGHFIYVNNSIVTMLGYAPKELSQMSLDQLLNSSGQPIKSCSQLAIQHKSGCPVYVELTSIPLKSDGQEIGSLIRFEPIPQPVEQSKEFTDALEMFSFISEKSQNILSSISADGVFTYISPTVHALLGYHPEEVIGKPAASFNHPETNKDFLTHRHSLFIDQDTVRFTGRVRHKNGEYRWYETTAEYIRDQSGKIIQTICVGRDITDSKAAQETIAYLAYHDSVTDLPNRRLFKQHVSQVLIESKKEIHSLMVLDLDGFKYVNDTYGHDMGDMLLIEVAKRLTAAAGDKRFVARWGGDEFTFFQTNIQDRSDVDFLMERIQDVLSEPISIAGKTLFISASIGVSYAPEEGDTVESLIKHADAAMYRVKKQGKKSFDV